MAPVDAERVAVRCRSFLRVPKGVKGDAGGCNREDDPQVTNDDDAQ